jgi:hypothetical protein
MVSPHEQMLFLFYYGAQPVDTKLSLRLPWATASGRDLLNDQVIPVKFQNGSVIFERRLAPGEVVVLEVREGGEKNVLQ